MQYYAMLWYYARADSVVDQTAFSDLLGNLPVCVSIEEL